MKTIKVIVCHVLFRLNMSLYKVNKQKLKELNSSDPLKTFLMKVEHNKNALAKCKKYLDKCDGYLEKSSELLKVGE